MAGVELLSYSVGPSAGQIRAGLGARVTSVRVSLWSGGLACVAAAGLICLALPRFAAYHAAAAGEAHPRAGETTESRTEAAQGAPPGKPVPAAGNPG